MRAFFIVKRREMKKGNLFGLPFFERRGEKTRTSDPLHPMQVR